MRIARRCAALLLQRSLLLRRALLLRQTHGRTRHRFNMLTNACAVRATMNVYGDGAFSGSIVARVNEVGGVA